MTLNQAADLFAGVVMALFVFILAASIAGLLTWVERKMSALIQDRIGPNRANIRLGRNWRLFGLVHPLADVIKMLTKEDFVPAGAQRVLHFLAPIICFIPPVTVFAVIPFADKIQIDYQYTLDHDVILGSLVLLKASTLDLWTNPISLAVADLDVGALFIFAITSLGVFGVMFAGWSSNNKFSFLGAMRGASQMVSYEVALGLTAVGLFMWYGGVSLNTVVEQQGQYFFGIIPQWGIVTQPLAFFLFLACGIAEIKRVPFDLPEGEAEIIAGYFTEYSSGKFTLFFFAEFIEIVVLGSVLSVFFLGGWQIPYLSMDGLAIWKYSTEFADWAFVQNNSWGLSLIHVVVALLQMGKFLAVMVACMWMLQLFRWTFPRFRYDQIMRMGWKMILPLALANIVLTGGIILIIRLIGERL